MAVVAAGMTIVQQRSTTFGRLSMLADRGSEADALCERIQHG
jgi:hypothetical protein